MLKIFPQKHSSKIFKFILIYDYCYQKVEGMNEKYCQCWAKTLQGQITMMPRKKYFECLIAR